MNCPNCGVYNPEDRETCWRCGEPLPQQEESKKRRNPQARARSWLYIGIAVFIIFTLLQMCGFQLPWQQSIEQQPSGLLWLSAFGLG